MWLFKPFKKKDGLVVSAGGTICVKTELTVKLAVAVIPDITQSLINSLYEKHFADVSSDKRVIKATQEVLKERAKRLANDLKEELNNNRKLYYGEEVS